MNDAITDVENHEPLRVAADAHEVHATSSLSDDRTRILKNNDTFVIFDKHGDLYQDGHGELGLYYEGTRYLSKMVMLICEKFERPLLLNSNLGNDCCLLTVDLTNPDISRTNPTGGDFSLHSGSIHFRRTKFLGDGTCHEKITIQNFAIQNVEFNLSLFFEADFADIFEIRGTARKKTGKLLEPEVAQSTLSLRYLGLDDKLRTSVIDFSGQPVITEKGAIYKISLAPQECIELVNVIRCIEEPSAELKVTLVPTQLKGEAFFDSELKKLVASQNHKIGLFPELSSSDARLNAWLGRSISDITVLTTENKFGLFRYAGIPWFATYFGRDGITTAFQCLWLNPELAKGVLLFLADTQATTEDAQNEAEPGKIVHEIRRGEMATLGEIPFGKYYGSVDSTPLFILLAGAYFDRTGDVDLITKIWSNIERALAWIEQYGDPGQRGLIAYDPKSKGGLTQQGWKDSADSVFHRDGTFVVPPTALAEVQGYAYAAYNAVAKLALFLSAKQQNPSYTSLAESCSRKAKTLYKNFNDKFWCESMGYYALALDGEGRACEVKTSNPGQCLFTQIIDPAHAAEVAKVLMSDEMYSGWGIRTLSRDERRYNPMSYHNGSIWPHDNSLIAFGLAKYGFQKEALKIFAGFLDATEKMELNRLPELFCGFDRSGNDNPILYPVACSPQAWASAAVFLLLQAILGIEIDAGLSMIRFRSPQLPDGVDELRLRNFRVGAAKVDFIIQRFNADTSVQVENRVGHLEVIVLK